MNQVTKSLILQIKSWGIGQVQSIIKDKVTVNFENVGKKVINAKNIELKKIVMMKKT